MKLILHIHKSDQGDIEKQSIKQEFENDNCYHIKIYLDINKKVVEKLLTFFYIIL